MYILAIGLFEGLSYNFVIFQPSSKNWLLFYDWLNEVRSDWFWMLKTEKPFIGQDVAEGKQNCFDLSLRYPHERELEQSFFLKFSMRVW